MTETTDKNCQPTPYRPLGNPYSAVASPFVAMESPYSPRKFCEGDGVPALTQESGFYLLQENGFKINLE